MDAHTGQDRRMGPRRQVRRARHRRARPFGALTVAVGATVRADLGIVKCRGVTVSIDAKAGVGFKIAPVAAEVLKFLPGVKLQTEYVPFALNILQRTAVRPKVPICGG